MDDPVVWLRKQLDDDEREARHAGQAGYGSWSAITDAPHGPQVRTLEADDPQWRRQVNVSMWECDDEMDGCPEVAREWIAEAEHIARWDPARVLREVAAKRRRLDRHRPEPYRHGGLVCAWCSAYNLGVEVAWPCPDIGDDFTVYADRPGYRPEWVPDAT